MKHPEKTTINPSLRDFDQLPDSAHIRPQVAKDILSISIASFWRLAKSQKIRTYKLTERTTTVNVGELRKFMAGKSEV